MDKTLISLYKLHLKYVLSPDIFMQESLQNQHLSPLTADTNCRHGALPPIFIPSNPTSDIILAWDWSTLELLTAHWLEQLIFWVGQLEWVFMKIMIYGFLSILSLPCTIKGTNVSMIRDKLSQIDNWIPNTLKSDASKLYQNSFNFNLSLKKNSHICLYPKPRTNCVRLCLSNS